MITTADQLEGMSVPEMVNVYRNVVDGVLEAQNRYRIGERSRFYELPAGVAPQGANADHLYHQEHKFFGGMSRARDLYDNDVVISQGVERFIINVIQGGFMVEPMSDDEQLNQDLKGDWGEWSTDRDRVEIQQEMDFHDIEKMALRACIVDGDQFVFPQNRDDRLEVVEAHRVRTPIHKGRLRSSVVHGVELDQLRRRKAVWVTRDEIDPNSQHVSMRDFARRNFRSRSGQRKVWQIYLRKRASQTRGITKLNPPADIASMHDEIQFAVALKQQLASFFAVIRERDLNFEGTAATDTGDVTTEVCDVSRIETDAAPGMEVSGEPGEKFHFDSPNIPSTEFEAHAKLLLQFISINLDMPLILFLLDASETNFSAWRGAMDQAKMSFRAFQRNLTSMLHTPTYEWRIRMRAGRDPALRRAIETQHALKHRWRYPTWPYVQPLDDVRSDIGEYQGSLNSMRRIQERNGRDWPVIAREIVDDNAIAIIAAKEKAQLINTQFKDDPNPVLWRELVALPLPEGVQLGLNQQQATVPNGNDQNTSQ